MAPLELVRGGFNPIEDFINETAVIASSDDLFRSALVLKIHAEDRVELVIRRQ